MVNNGRCVYFKECFNNDVLCDRSVLREGFLLYNKIVENCNLWSCNNNNNHLSTLPTVFQWIFISNFGFSCRKYSQCRLFNAQRRRSLKKTMFRTFEICCGMDFSTKKVMGRHHNISLWRADLQNFFRTTPFCIVGHTTGKHHTLNPKTRHFVLVKWFYHCRCQQFSAFALTKSTTNDVLFLRNFLWSRVFLTLLQIEIGWKAMVKLLSCSQCQAFLNKCQRNFGFFKPRTANVNRSMRSHERILPKHLFHDTCSARWLSGPKVVANYNFQDSHQCNLRLVHITSRNCGFSCRESNQCCTVNAFASKNASCYNWTCCE